MAHHILRLGPLGLALIASRAGASLTASLSGRPWDALVDRLRGPRRNPVGAQAAGDGPAISAAEFARMEFRQQVESLSWYHTHDFGEGIKSRGQFDHAPILDRYCLPADLGGKRVLDVATFDVVHAGDFLLHLNNPVRALQNMAKACGGYALISEPYAPELDIPGQGLLAEYRGGSHDVTWWRFSLPTLERMILDAGFARVERLARFRYGPAGLPDTMHHVVFRAWKH
jgi:SAM-dependent methyltransferase